MAKKMDEYNGVFEVYFKGKPLKRPFYSSARNFAWSSGLYIWACETIGFDPNKKGLAAGKYGVTLDGGEESICAALFQSDGKLLETIQA